MRLAQGLYEAGHITYMRTDSTRTSASSRQTAKDFITSKWGSEFVGKGAVRGKSASGVQDAHEAIRPTNPLSELPNGLDESQARLYRLIWSRFVASQMCDSEWTSMKIQAKVETFDKFLVLLVFATSETANFRGSNSLRFRRLYAMYTLNRIIIDR